MVVDAAPEGTEKGTSGSPSLPLPFAARLSPSSLTYSPNLPPPSLSQIHAMDDGTFPVLLKTLSDPAEEVIKRDLRLLAQISSSSDETYFTAFMVNLLELFSTDRRLLETRGSLIIRQLCVNLNAEKIYRTLSEILEKEEVRYAPRR
jgi:hypothetical protein